VPYILWGGAPADFTYNASTGAPVGSVELEAWPALTGGSRLTDLKLFDGDLTEGAVATSGYFTSATDGTVRVWVPDTVTQVWVTQKDSTGSRWKLDPIDQTERIKALEDANYIPDAEKGAVNGVAPLGSDGKVSATYLPAASTSGVIDITTANGGTDSGNVTLTAADLGAVPTSRTVSSGTGLTGGGDLSTNRTLAVVFGSTAGTVAQGNDPRFGTTGTSPRPVYAVVLSNDAPADRKAAAASDPYTWVCDGTNDEVQINLAINAASPKQSYNAGMPATAASLGKVVLSGGRFNIGTAGIKMRSAVHLEGAGIASTEVRAVSCNQPGMISLASANDHLCQVSNMWLNGNSGGGGTCSAIDFDMTGSGSTSLYPDSNPDSDHHIHDLFIDEFRGTNRHGIYLHATGTANNRGNIIDRIQIRDCTGGSGIYLSAASDSFISNCHVGGSGLNGYHIATGNTKISNCKSYYSLQNGFLFTSGRGVITGCESQDDETGFNFDASPTTATSLVADTSNVAGIRVSTDRLQVVSFNIFVRGGGKFATQQRGIWYDQATAFTNCAILGNVESDNITTPISGPPATGFNQVTVS
jgi:hypothetical protein